MNDRDTALFRAGREAALDVAVGAVGAVDLLPDERRQIAEDLTASRDALSAEYDALAAAEVAEDVPEWGAVLRPLQAWIAVLDTRAEAVTGDWPPSGPLEPPDPATDESALTGLGLLGRDCQQLATVPGPDAGAPEFAVAAATTCAEIVDRRRLSDFRADADANLTALAALAEGDEVAPSAELTAALEDLRAEWQETSDELAEVPTDQLTEAAAEAAWATNLQLAQDRVDVFTARIAALESGDQDEIARAWTDGPGEPGWEWPLGLDQRDCRTVEA